MYVNLALSFKSIVFIKTLLSYESVLEDGGFEILARLVERKDLPC